MFVRISVTSSGNIRLRVRTELGVKVLTMQGHSCRRVGLSRFAYDCIRMVRNEAKPVSFHALSELVFRVVHRSISGNRFDMSFIRLNLTR